MTRTVPLPGHIVLKHTQPAICSGLPAAAETQIGITAQQLGLTSRKTVTSMLMMSPSRSGLESGMPWHSTSLTEVQTLFGKAPAVTGCHKACTLTEAS